MEQPFLQLSLLNWPELLYRLVREDDCQVVWASWLVLEIGQDWVFLCLVEFLEAL